jgi:hypothetical protein
MTAKELAIKNMINTINNFVYLDTDTLTVQDPMYNYYHDYHRRTILLFPVSKDIYTYTVQEFLDICSDAETNGIEVHYIGGKLYYSYMI